MDPPVDRTKLIQCFRYSIDLLRKLLSEASGTSPRQVHAKLHLTYLEEYLGHFENPTDPLTILVEWRYTDRDFLEDYASYYVRCFEQKYRAECVRLHFFRGVLGEPKLQKLISSPREVIEGELEDRYLGFLVVKPIPSTFIGRTCLRTYEDAGRRNFPATRTCEAHLLGLDWRIESLAYQEQDTVAAACATSALWSVLHATARLFEHNVYTPVEITRLATERFPTLGRSFPNAGLTPNQIVAAIGGVGLEPEKLAVREKSQLQSTAYAYLRAGIPSLLIARLFDLSDPAAPEPYRGDWECTHAVAVTGYSLGKSQPEPLGNTSTLLRSSQIDKLYVHDDQVGPFARLEFDALCFKVRRPTGELLRVGFTMASSWRGKNNKIGSVLFAPVMLIVPVYHKIRVEYRLIQAIVLRADEKYRKTFLADPEWDIFLTLGTEFKKELRDSEALPPDIKREWLERPLPRFLWRASCSVQRKTVVDLLYDATDIAQSTTLKVGEIWH